MNHDPLFQHYSDKITANLLWLPHSEEYPLGSSDLKILKWADTDYRNKNGIRRKGKPEKGATFFYVIHLTVKDVFGPWRPGTLTDYDGAYKTLMEAVFDPTIVMSFTMYGAWDKKWITRGFSLIKDPRTGLIIDPPRAAQGA
jgi:hypothetical protein